MNASDASPAPADAQADAMPSYVPLRARLYWGTLEPVVTSCVAIAARKLGRDPHSLLPPAAAFALWAWQTRGVPPEANRMFRRRLVEEFVHLGMADYTRGSRATYRSALVAIADAVTPAYEKTTPLPRSQPTPPYTTSDVAALRS